LETGKVFYGGTNFLKEELAEAAIQHEIELEYYKTTSIVSNKNPIFYGIEIVKKEYIKDETELEAKTVNCITNEEEVVDQILGTLKRNKVTPIALKDVLSDMCLSELS